MSFRSSKQASRALGALFKSTFLDSTCNVYFLKTEVLQNLWPPNFLHNHSMSWTVLVCNGDYMTHSHLPQATNLSITPLNVVAATWMRISCLLENKPAVKTCISQFLLCYYILSLQAKACHLDVRHKRESGLYARLERKHSIFMPSRRRYSFYFQSRRQIIMSRYDWAGLHSFPKLNCASGIQSEINSVSPLPKSRLLCASLCLKVLKVM